MTPQDEHRAWLLKGLAELKAGPKLCAIKGDRPHIRQQLHLSEIEHRALTTMRCCLMMHVGRPVSLALTMRVALDSLLRECNKSMNDAAIGARLKATLLNVRSERAK